MRAYLNRLIGKTPLWRAVAVGVGYGALGYLCLIFTRFGAPVESIWLSNALLTAALFAAPRAHWPLILACAAAGHVSAHLLTGDAPAFTAAFLAGDMAEAIVCASLLRLRPGMLAFQDSAGVFLFLLVCAFSALVSATIALTGSWFTAQPLATQDFLTWFAADALALIIFLPIFHGFGELQWRRVQQRPRRLAAALLVIVTLSTLVAFGLEAPALRFLVLPLFVLVAFDLGLAGVQLCLGVLLITWAALTFSGHPPGAWPEMDMRWYMLMVQSLVAALAATAMPLAVAIEEKERVSEKLARVAKEEAVKIEAEKAHAFKSRLLVTASHDLRQPLQAAKTYLAALDQRLADPELRAICANTGQALDAMSGIMETLLDVSKLEAGAITPRQSDFLVDDLLKRVIASNKPQADAKGLEMRLQPSGCVVRSDPNLLERVVDNLVSNAIRYTDKGSVTVWCEARGQTAEIGVTDTGIGIEPEALDQIFDDYVQLNNPERDRRKGLGLGLAIARRMSELLGSRIEVRSKMGEGSTFSIAAPLGGPIAAPAPDAARAAAAEAGSLQVLFIDDDPVIGDAMSIVFRDAGIDLALARDGEAAAARVAAGLRPDVIVSDFRLPGSNGSQVIRRLRQMLGAQAPAIILTGDTGFLEVEKQDNCAVLHKPVDSAKLIALARQIAVKTTAAAEA